MTPRLRAWPVALAARAAGWRRQAVPLGTLLLGGLAGVGIGGWFWQDETTALAQLQDEVQALHVLQARRPASEAQALAVPPAQPLAADAPAAAQALQVWAWLQQGLQVHGLQLQSLRPGALEQPAGLPSQTVVLAVQGRWQDWLAFERRLGLLAPWWASEQWQVLALEDRPEADDVVQVQWHARMAWRPTPAVALPPTEVQAGAHLPAWPAVVAGLAPVGGMGQDAGVGVGVGVGVASAAAGAGPAGPDPLRWPVKELQLQGTWAQSGVWHAVLGRGLQQVVVRPGQRVGREGLRVQQVSETGLRLLPADAAGPPLQLNLPGASR